MRCPSDLGVHCGHSVGITDLGVLIAIAAKLLAPVQQEQVAQHREFQLAPKAPTPAAPEKRRITGKKPPLLTAE